eukprot:TRINITY_DN76794_c0_g1_i1.p1 TRINITY_DN76794_c0_g1~~TRINITY_DN76794_c0_g1_i1.p1  ORF type:complete len:252 (+),score=31.43 TRINITY_DN76794_c0_g1_i1:213-968(+)
MSVWDLLKPPSKTNVTDATPGGRTSGIDTSEHRDNSPSVERDTDEKDHEPSKNRQLAFRDRLTSGKHEDKSEQSKAPRNNRLAQELRVATPRGSAARLLPTKRPLLSASRPWTSVASVGKSCEQSSEEQTFNDDSVENLMGRWSDANGSKYFLFRDRPGSKELTARIIRPSGAVKLMPKLIFSDAEGNIFWGKSYKLDMEAILDGTTTVKWLPLRGDREYVWSREEGGGSSEDESTPKQRSRSSPPWKRKK